MGSRKTLIRRLAPWLLFGPICLFHWRILFLRELPNGGDLLNQFIPWRTFALDCLKNGYLPLWNPYVFCGAPFWANIQTAILFPWNLLHLALDVPTFFAFCLVIHHLIAAGGMYLFFKNRWPDPLSALVAATVYAWGGFFILHANDGHWIHIQAYAYIPFCLLAQDRLRLGFSWLRFTGLVVPLALMILAGHLQLPLYLFYLLVFRAVWFCFGTKPFRRGASLTAVLGDREFKSFLVTVAGIAVALLFCAAVLLPLFRLSMYSSTRAGGADYRFATHDSMPPLHLATILAPFLYGDPTLQEPDQRFWETTIGYHEICGYAGVVSLVLVFFAFVPLSKRNRLGSSESEESTTNGSAGASPSQVVSPSQDQAIEERDAVIERRFALALLVISLILSLGRYTPFYRVVYLFLPGFDYFRVPARLVLFYGFSVALLAGLGMRRLAQGSWWDQKQRLSVILLLGAGLLLLLTTVLAVVNRNGIWNLLLHIEAERSRVGMGLPPEAYDTVAARLPTNLIDGRLHAVMSGIGFAALWFWLGLVGAAVMNCWGRRFSFLALILWGLVFGDLFWFSHRFIPTFPREKWTERYYPEADFLKLPQSDKQSYRVLFTDEVVIGTGIPSHQECKHNRPMLQGIQSVRGYDPIQLLSFASFVNVMQRRDPSTPQGGMLYIRALRSIPPLGYQLTAVKYIVTALNVPDSFELIWADAYSPLRMYRYPDAQPEVRLLGDPNGTVQVLTKRPGLLTVTAHTERDATLFWSQCDYPGWRVTVDGEKQPIKPYMDVFLQAEVPAGDHTVQFTFQPVIVYWGMGISVLTVVALILLCLRDKRSRRRCDRWD